MRPFPSSMLLGVGAIPLWNVADKAADITVNAVGNIATRGAGSTGTHQVIRGVAGRSSGKLYFELVVNTATGNTGVAVSPTGVTLTNYPGAAANSGALVIAGDTVIYNNAITTASKVVAGTAPRTYGVHFDLTGALIYFSTNGAFASGVNPATPSGGLSMPALTYFPAANLFTTGDNMTLNTKGPFTYTPTAGYSAWG